MSTDGIKWERVSQIANIEEGHYQVSAATATKAATAFNYHPTAFQGNKKRKGLNWRTNLYYLETTDMGKTWQSIDGQQCQLPVTEKTGPALIHDFESEGLLVYLKDLVLAADGTPHILYLTAKGYQPGPTSGSRDWHLARWNGKTWDRHHITSSDNNYDMGSLYLESNGDLTLIAPTSVGPQAGNPGGEVIMWHSKNNGKSWRKHKQLTQNSPYNHTYVRRPVNAHNDFYAFWADGDARQPSPSRLYFSNSDGDVLQMPMTIK